MITYCRMEAKLIHGQTTTILRSYHKCDGIILVDDATAADVSMKRIYAAATPQGIKPYFFTMEKGVEQLRKAEASDLAYFAIFRNSIEVARAIKMGYKFPLPITCGQQFVRQGTYNIMNGVGLTEEEVQAMEYIASTGAELVFDPSCKNENMPWSEAKKLLDAARQKAAEQKS